MAVIPLVFSEMLGVAFVFLGEAAALVLGFFLDLNNWACAGITESAAHANSMRENFILGCKILYLKRFREGRMKKWNKSFAKFAKY
jgi:hypothetical protein